MKITGYTILAVFDYTNDINMKEFKINKSKFYRYLVANIILILLFSGLLIYFWIVKNANENTFFVFFALIILGIMLGAFAIYPTYCIISQYKYEQDVVFTIDNKNKECIYQKRKKSIKFKFDDVKYTYSNSTPVGIILMYSFGWYIEILLKSGKSIYLSSLLDVDDRYLASVFKMKITYQSVSNMIFPIDEYWMIGVKDNDL